MLRALFLAALLAAPAAAAPPPVATSAVKPAAAPAKCEGTTEYPVPRFASIKPGKAFVRSGPEDRFPITWVYVKKGLPVEIVREYCIWRQIRDADGATGWINKSLLSGERTLLVQGGIRTLYVSPDLQSRVAFRIEPGAIASVTLCDGVWCRVSNAGRAGYILRAQSWGSYPGEAIGG